MQPRDIAGLAEAEADARVEVAGALSRSIMVRNDSRIDTPLIGSVGSWRGLRAAQRPSAWTIGSASSPQSVAS